jgi:hypothetical protein
MVLILLEALGALTLLLLIVWWTMFSGRKNGEPPSRPSADAAESTSVKPPQTTAQDPPEGRGRY